MSKPAITLLALALLALAPSPRAQTWQADNGNGTYTNPLFFEEFSDPDMIRVGKDFYATTTTMHSMPGLPVLHSKDLVNWSFESYALDRLDLGPEYRLENGGQIYGRSVGVSGRWPAPWPRRPVDTGRLPVRGHGGRRMPGHAQAGSAR